MKKKTEKDFENNSNKEIDKEEVILENKKLNTQIIEPANNNKEKKAIKFIM